MDFSVEINNFGRFFSMPCTVADNCLKDVDGDFLKVLIFITSMGNSTLSDIEIAEKTGVSLKKITQAVEFWANKEIIRVKSNDFIGFSPEIPAASKTSPQHTDAALRERAENVAYTAGEISELINKNPDLKFLFDKLQTSLGKLLNFTEQKGFIYIYEFYGFDAASILMIVEYCVGLGKTNIAYIKTVARDFFEKDIVSYKDIEREIILRNKRNHYENRIAAAFGITTRLTPTQLKYINSWETLGVSVELASYAYEKCVDNKGKMIMKYIDTTLNNWIKGGIKTVEEAKNEKKPPDVKEAKQESSHSYNLDEIDELQKNFLLKRKNKG